jgi:hypothetical protein
VDAANSAGNLRKTQFGGYGSQRPPGRQMSLKRRSCRHTSSFSRHEMSELLEMNHPQIKRGRRECRMRVAPEAACAAKSTRVSNQGYTATAGIPCTMVLTVSFVLLGDHCLVATVARKTRERLHDLSACIGAPGPHDFAVRTNAARRAMNALGDVRPSHPLPNVRDDREPPLLWAGTSETVSLIWGKREAEYFCAKGWTGFRARRLFCPTGCFAAGDGATSSLRTKRRNP